MQRIFLFLASNLAAVLVLSVTVRSDDAARLVSTVAKIAERALNALPTGALRDASLVAASTEVRIAALQQLAPVAAATSH